MSSSLYFFHNRPTTYPRSTQILPVQSFILVTLGICFLAASESLFVKSYSYTNSCIFCVYVHKNQLVRSYLALSPSGSLSVTCVSFPRPAECGFLYRISTSTRILFAYIYYTLHMNQPIDRFSFSIDTYIGYRSTPHVAYSVLNNSILYPYD